MNAVVPARSTAGGPSPEPAGVGTADLVAGQQRTGGARSLTRRMIVVAMVWISILLFAGGFALDRVQIGRAHV